jgi:hypothetical protein
LLCFASILSLFKWFKGLLVLVVLLSLLLSLAFFFLNAYVNHGSHAYNNTIDLSAIELRKQMARYNLALN